MISNWLKDIKQHIVLMTGKQQLKIYFQIFMVFYQTNLKFSVDDRVQNKLWKVHGQMAKYVLCKALGHFESWMASH